MGGAMAFTGMVTKVGVMNKTATVTVPRYIIHKRTGKVCTAPLRYPRTEQLTILYVTAHREEHEDIDARRAQPTELFYAELQLDDTVFIRHTAPISARKRFTLEKILKSPFSDAVEAKAAMVAAAAKAQGRLDRAAARDQAAAQKA
ncbi:hypothetical protein HWV62_6459 [Athelia sp. TMB]|nr:hypothetical protein HWV62_6459 [Athelia sp. TMB]